MPLVGTRGCSILPLPRGLHPRPGAWFLGGAHGGSLSNPPIPPSAAPQVPGERPPPRGRQPRALCSRPGPPPPTRPGFAHESPSISHGPRPPAATSAGHAPGSPALAPRPQEDGSQRGETASAERGRRRVGGHPGGVGDMVSPLPRGAPRWGPLEASGQGRGWGQGEHSGSNLLPQILPGPPAPAPDHPSPRQVLPGGCTKERAQLSAGTGARPGAGDTAQPALPHAGGCWPPWPAAAGTQETVPGGWHLPRLHGGGSRG